MRTISYYTDDIPPLDPYAKRVLRGTIGGPPDLLIEPDGTSFAFPLRTVDSNGSPIKLHVITRAGLAARMAESLLDGTYSPYVGMCDVYLYSGKSREAYRVKLFSEGRIVDATLEMGPRSQADVSFTGRVTLPRKLEGSKTQGIVFAMRDADAGLVEVSVRGGLAKACAWAFKQGQFEDREVLVRGTDTALVRDGDRLKFRATQVTAYIEDAADCAFCAAVDSGLCGWCLPPIDTAPRLVSLPTAPLASGSTEPGPGAAGVN